MIDFLAEKIVCLCIGYLCGLILVGFFLGKLADVDLRQKGSGNVGTTNTTRVLGAKKGIITLICDVGKGFLAAGICYLLFGRLGIMGGAEMSADDIRCLMVYGAFGAVIGHDFPFYMGFTGGKGVATSLAFLTVVNPWLIPPSVVLFAIIVLRTRYVSLASVTVAVFVIIFMYAYYGREAFGGSGIMLEILIITTIAALLLIYRHRENIKRLIQGNENKLSFGKSGKKE